MHERRGAGNFQCADEKVDASEKASDTLLHLGTSLRQEASTDLWSLVF
jgi:TolA-binding protein